MSVLRVRDAPLQCSRFDHLQLGPLSIGQQRLQCPVGLHRHLPNLETRLGSNFLQLIVRMIEDRLDLGQLLRREVQLGFDPVADSISKSVWVMAKFGSPGPRLMKAEESAARCPGNKSEDESSDQSSF